MTDAPLTTKRLDAIEAEAAEDQGLGYNYSSVKLDDLRRLLAAARRCPEVERENTRLRAALALSDRPCAYCTLPAAEWSACESGFPGCARADDAMGCPELGARMALDATEAENARLRAAIAAYTGKETDDG
jgi:hypothetical protein